jgi:AraC-like DNA-binding protein
MVPLLLAYAKQRGLDVLPFVKKYELPREVLEQSGKATLVTKISVLPAIAEELSLALKDPHVGLSIAAWSPRGAYGVVEFLARAGPTLRHAWANVLRFNSILGPDNSFHLDEVAGEARFTHCVTRQPDALGRHINEYVSAILTRTQGEISGLKPSRAWFVNSRPEQLDLRRMQNTFSTTDFSFDAPDNGFAFPASALELPVRGGDPALYSYLEEHAMAALASRPQSDDLIDKLRHALREALKQGEPNVERLAKRLSLSGRTLQRRLTTLKTSFQEVLDHVRFDLARQYLKDARLELTQIAYLLGYSELRAFDRAFRRWAQKSPGDWRAST